MKTLNLSLSFDSTDKSSMPFVIVDNKYQVVTASDKFNNDVVKVNIGDDLLRIVLKHYKQAQWKECVDNFTKNDSSLEIKNILFIPKNTVIKNRTIPVIQYWFLQTINLGGNKIIVFHNNKFDSSLDHIFTNFVDYANNLQNDVEFHFHRKTRSVHQHTCLNPYIYAFFMPYLAKKNFHIAQGKLFRDCFNIEADLRVGNIVQKELDCMRVSDKSADIRKFREEYLNKNFIPFAQITFPMILSI